MFDPVPRSHMFMIDARRMSGSGCCSSTQRHEEARINRIARNYWNVNLQRRVGRITPNILRDNYRHEPEFGNLIALHDEALDQWLSYARDNFSRQSSHELITEFERILAQYYHDVRAITNVIQARRHPVINRNNEQAMAMADLNNTEQRVEQ